MKRFAFILLTTSCMTLCSMFFASAEAQGSQAPSPTAPNDSARAVASSDLIFPDEAEPASAVTTQRMATLKPAGAGPFPAMSLKAWTALISRSCRVCLTLRRNSNSIALALDADPSKVLKLGMTANEGTVKTTDLSKYKIIVFATHGLVPGELNGLTQPALALSAPDVAGVDGDGLLTMEERHQALDAHSSMPGRARS
jgi:hypothetical protein